MLLLGDILRRHATVRGEKTAYVVGDQRLTYRVFHESSNRLGHALHRLGVRRGDRVAVMANNCVEYPLIYFAAIKLGAIVVPINARFTSTEAANIIAHAEAETLFVASELESITDQPQPTVKRRISIDAGSGGLMLPDLMNAESSDELDVQVDENDAHVMLYTSGTTGSPKGALLTHRSYYLQATTSHLQLGFAEDDIAVSMFPMFHMGGWAMPLGFWHTGATAIIMPRADPRAILETIERERATYFYAVPTVFRSLLALPDFERFDLSSLRLLGGGTAAMTQAQVQEIVERFRCRRMVILYGSTEAGPVSVVRPDDIGRKSESVGRPYLDVEVKLVDESGNEVGQGAVGEICVRSEFTMKGYWRNEQETSQALRDGWVRTGDLGIFDAEGFLSIVGRRKEVIRSGGENIFPVEIERILLSHPDIREASVLGIPDEHWGEAVIAAVVMREGAVLTADEVAEHVRKHLASYKKPRHVFFLASLPRTPASRQVHKPLLREILLERIANAAPSANHSVSERR